MKKLIPLLALVLALVVVPVASSTTTRPIQCFKAHHWIVKGTNKKGKAWPRPKSNLRYAQWVFYAPGQPEYILSVGLNHRQLRVYKLCLK